MSSRMNRVSVCSSGEGCARTFHIDVDMRAGQFREWGGLGSGNGTGRMRVGGEAGWLDEKRKTRAASKGLVPCVEDTVGEHWLGRDSRR